MIATHSCFSLLFDVPVHKKYVFDNLLFNLITTAANLSLAVFNAPVDITASNQPLSHARVELYVVGLTRVCEEKDRHRLLKWISYHPDILYIQVGKLIRLNGFGGGLRIDIPMGDFKLPLS